MDREGDKTLTDCLGAKKLRPPKPKGTKQGEKKTIRPHRGGWPTIIGLHVWISQVLTQT